MRGNHLAYAATQGIKYYIYSGYTVVLVFHTLTQSLYRRVLRFDIAFYYDQPETVATTELHTQRMDSV